MLSHTAAVTSLSLLYGIPVDAAQFWFILWVTDTQVSGSSEQLCHAYCLCLMVYGFINICSVEDTNDWKCCWTGYADFQLYSVRWNWFCQSDCSIYTPLLL
jgi:hypothetical protein